MRHFVNCRCRRSGLEIRDGGTEGSPLLGVFCNEMPHTQKSTGNTMFVRYYSNADSPNTGFYAKASIGKGKVLYNTFPGVRVYIH